MYRTTVLTEPQHKVSKWHPVCVKVLKNSAVVRLNILDFY